MGDWETACVMADENTRTNLSWCKADQATKVAQEPDWFSYSAIEGVRVTEEMLPKWKHPEDASASVTTRALHYESPELEKVSVDGRDRYETGVSPVNIVSSFHIRVHLKNVYNLMSVRAAVDGMAAGWYFKENGPMYEKVVSLFEEWSLTKEEDDPTMGHVDATVCCFGLPFGHRGGSVENILTLQLLLVDGKSIVSRDIPVGDLIRITAPHEQRDRDRNLALELELSIDAALPDVAPADGSEGSFSAFVEDWGDDEYLEIPI